jgi:tripeptidyl-peptidase-1
MLSFALAALASSQLRLSPEADIVAGTSPSWAVHAKPEPATPIRLTVAVTIDQERRDALESIFWKVSDPKDEAYGKHLSVDEITKVLDVPLARVARVSKVFAAAGASTSVSRNRDYITVELPVGAAEKLLQTEILWYSHKTYTEARILRASRGYSLPAEIAADVLMVGELLQFPSLYRPTVVDEPAEGEASPTSGWANACDSFVCNKKVTPAVLATRYKISNTSAASANNSMAVAEFQGQFYKDKDLALFTSSCHAKVSVERQIGTERQSAGVEAELDVEFIKAVAPEIDLAVVYNAQYSLLNWCNQITDLDDSPLVHSVSYGNDEKQQSSTTYMETTNTAFMKAGVAGISILFASGDQGVCGRSGCGGFLKKTRFSPDFPGGSPYITAVGGTDFAGSDIGDEKAWSDSGGGFSDTFAIPAYQAEAVAAYKASADADLPPADYWNNTGRGYPDVSALGGTKNTYCVATGGRFAGVAGTSASSPVVAGVFAKLNGIRLAAGKPSLGFLNPFIYQNPSAFQDVKLGVNNAGTKYGFKAVEGWDAATGFGTPDFAKLAALV